MSRTLRWSADRGGVPPSWAGVVVRITLVGATHTRTPSWSSLSAPRQPAGVRAQVGVDLKRPAITEMLVGVQVASTGGVSIGGARVAPLTTTEPESVVPPPDIGQAQASG